MKQLITISDRINARMKELNLKNKHLVEATGATKGSVSQWVNGGNDPSSRYISSLARVLQVSEQWLIEGGLFDENIQESIRPSLKRRVPLISISQATNWKEMMTNSFNDFKHWVEVSGDVSTYSFAIKMSGDSMSSTDSGISIPDGSIVIIDPEETVISGRIIAGKFKNTQEVMIKKYTTDGPNSYLISLNKNYQSILIDDTFEIIGVCVQVQINLL
ncbi:TPA: helix-turn-helix domain-containing protein [Morganella morganii]|nr:helix-turn-helix domain-containing protein [Morganella morganii]